MKSTTTLSAIMSIFGGFMLLIFYITFVGLTCNPSIGKIEKIDSVVDSNYKVFEIYTNRDLRIYISHYNEIPYIREYNTTVIANFKDGSRVKIWSNAILMQLPDSISRNPFKIEN